MSPRGSYAGRFSVVSAALLVIFLSASSALLAQDEAPNPKVDIFAGYSWYNPGSSANGFQLKSNNAGGAAAGAYNFNKFFAFEIDGSIHYDNNNRSATAMLGPRIQWRAPQFQPFIHLLGGAQWLSIDPLGISKNLGFGLRAGGGIDVPITKHFAWRMIEADYLYSHQNIFPTSQRALNLEGEELRTGLVLFFGGEKPLPPMSATCQVQQGGQGVLAGEPVSVNMTVTNIPPKHTVTYDWKTTGGKPTPNNNGVQIDTNGLAPGSYTVTGTATDTKPRKNEAPATCTAQFTINEPPKHPPTISCSVNPTTVRSGDPVTVTCTGQSPDNRPLTYNYTASAGRVTPNGATATLDTAGTPAGPITVNATVSDDRGLTASTSATANVEVPPPPPQASKINEILFNKNPKKPWRVDNEAKAILDDVALRLQREPDARAVIVGDVDPNEKGGDQLAQHRAVNTKAYLTQEKGIDPSRIDVRTGTAGGQRAEIYLVPAGATFSVPGTNTFDESKVPPQTDRPAAPAGRRRAPAKKPAAH